MRMSTLYVSYNFKNQYAGQLHGPKAQGRDKNTRRREGSHFRVPGDLWLAPMLSLGRFLSLIFLHSSKMGCMHLLSYWTGNLMLTGVLSLTENSRGKKSTVRVHVTTSILLCWSCRHGDCYGGLDKPATYSQRRGTLLAQMSWLLRVCHTTVPIYILRKVCPRVWTFIILNILTPKL